MHDDDKQDEDIEAQIKRLESEISLEPGGEGIIDEAREALATARIMSNAAMALGTTTAMLTVANILGGMHKAFSTRLSKGGNTALLDKHAQQISAEFSTWKEFVDFLGKASRAMASMGALGVITDASPSGKGDEGVDTAWPPKRS